MLWDILANVLDHGSLSLASIDFNSNMDMYLYTSVAAPLKFENGYVISSHTSLGMWLFIHVGIEVYPC